MWLRAGLRYEARALIGDYDTHCSCADVNVERDPVVGHAGVPDAVAQELGHEQAQLAQLIGVQGPAEPVEGVPSLAGRLGPGSELQVQPGDHVVVPPVDSRPAGGAVAVPSALK